MVNVKGIIMKKFLALFLLLAVFTAIKAQSEKELLDTLKERIEVGKTVQGISVAVIDEKGTRFINYGKKDAAGTKNVNENTLYEIGSITKTFTGILLAIAIEKGEVKLDDPISKYLPATVKTPSRGGKEITLIDLVTHSSGFPSLPTNFKITNMENPYADYTVSQMYEFLGTYQLTRDIGKQYEYSNYGMGLLGHILSLRAKMSYENLVKMRILKPLKMNDTAITLSSALKAKMSQGFDSGGEPTSNWDIPTLAGAGALRSNTKDMAKFIAANAGLIKSNLSSAFEASHKAQRDAVAGRMKIGFGWHILNTPEGDVVWHNGGTGGFRTFTGFLNGKKKAIIVLCNTSESVDDIGMHFFDATKPLAKVKPMFPVNEKILDEYLGQYELAPNMIFTVTRKNDKLYVQLTGQPNIRVFAETENKFYLKAVPAQIIFNRGANGKVESLTLIQNGNQIAKKIK